MNAIEIQGLVKDFKGRRAVDALSLEVPQGELFALLGPNGAGKTTTLRMLSCLIPPTAGDALLMGHSVRTDPAGVKAAISLSPQETAVAGKLTVRENLELIAGIYGANASEAKKKAAEMLDTFGLADRARDFAGKLSGGQQRRLSIAMALISRPEILFLDEPTLGLDVRARRELWKTIESLRGRVTVILTTHYLEEAAALAQRVGVMDKGTLRALGTVEEICRAAGTDNLEDAFLALTEPEEEA